MQPRLIMKMRLASTHEPAPDIRVLNFVRVLPGPLPPQPPGAHVDVHLPNGHVNAYSLCGDPHESQVFTIAVRRQSEGRGGSEWLHRGLKVDDVVPISAPRNRFPLQKGHAHTVLLAAGIGITPILSMARALHADGASFELHYSTRAGSPAPFADELRHWLCASGRFFHYPGGRSGPRGFRPAALARRLSADTQVYCCGPIGYMEAVRAACAAFLPDEQLHFEAFEAMTDDAFVPAECHVQMASTGQALAIPAHTSLLQALREQGFDIPARCEKGVCGTCEIGYRSGKVIHRDAVLGASARQHRLMPCVSRTQGTVVLDL